MRSRKRDRSFEGLALALQRVVAFGSVSQLDPVRWERRGVQLRGRVDVLPKAPPGAPAFVSLGCRRETRPTPVRQALAPPPADRPQWSAAVVRSGISRLNKCTEVPRLMLYARDCTADVGALPCPAPRGFRARGSGEEGRASFEAWPDLWNRSNAPTATKGMNAYARRPPPLACRETGRSMQASTAGGALFSLRPAALLGKRRVLPRSMGRGRRHRCIARLGAGASLSQAWRGVPSSG